ncbi:SF-assemblin [Hexamita inflata]|uniref:SF-assemblin n=1 Tax=Hexamita inflata TaxID=28002 RepID=A0AA86PPN4_9EUKA|nr:SF-assemblin [Hexamita inflata]
MAHIQNLKLVTQKIDDFNDALQIKIQKQKEQNFQQMVLLKDATQHMDRVLQIETRRRKQQMQAIKDTVAALKIDIETSIDTQISQISEKFTKEQESKFSQTEKMTEELKLTTQSMQKLLDDWKSAQSQSTQMLKTLLDKSRADRIARASDTRQFILTQKSQFQIRLDQWVNMADRETLNAAVMGQNMNKEYESENQNGFQGSEALINRLDQRTRQEIIQRNAKLNEIVSTLTRCVEMSQVNIGQAAKFIEK